MNRLRGENRLVSLVEKAKSECQSIALAVRHDFRTIEEAREAGLTWGEITEGLGFHQKWREVQRAYSREKARRENKGVKESPNGQLHQKTEKGKQKTEVPTRPIPRVEGGKNENLDDFFRQHLIN